MHALEEIYDKLRGGRQTPSSSFVMIGAGDRLLRAEAVPHPQPAPEFAGFVLVFTDVSGQWESDRQSGQPCPIGCHRACGGPWRAFRVAVEVIRDYPDLGPLQTRAVPTGSFDEETLAVGAALERLTVEYGRYAWGRGPLVPMRVEDLLATVGKRTEEQLGLHLAAEPLEERLWVRIDSYALVLGLVFLLGRLQEKFGLSSPAVRIPAEIAIHEREYDFIWRGPCLRLDTLRQWERQPVAVAGDFSTIDFSGNRRPAQCRALVAGGRGRRGSLSAFVTSGRRTGRNPSGEPPHPAAQHAPGLFRLRSFQSTRADPGAR